MLPRYVDERNALHSAIEPALEEDAKGSVSMATRTRIADAVSNFRSKFMQNSSDFEPGYQDALDYFTTMASLTRLLNDPSMKAFLAKLDDGEERTVGDLVAFMHVHNFRFGAATSDRQIEIYTWLVPALTAIRDQTRTEGVTPTTPDRTGVSNSERGYHVFSDVGTKLEFVGFNEAVHVRVATDIFSRIGLTRCRSDPYIPSAGCGDLIS